MKQVILVTFLLFLFSCDKNKYFFELNRLDGNWISVNNDSKIRLEFKSAKQILVRSATERNYRFKPSQVIVKKSDTYQTNGVFWDNYYVKNDKYDLSFSVNEENDSLYMNGYKNINVYTADSIYSILFIKIK